MSAYENSLIFPGNILPGFDLVVVAIPTPEVDWGGGKYEEWSTIIYDGEEWDVIEWCHEHNCFIATPQRDNPFETNMLNFGVEGSLVMLEFHRKIWGDVPTCDLHKDIQSEFQTRMF